MHSLILHIISKSHTLWQVHAQSHLPRHIKIPPPLASTCTSLILHIISKSHPLRQVHAQSHLPRHIKIPPPLASTCTVSSYTSYQNPTPSGKYMHSLILHIISKSHPLWQVHAQSHLTHHIKIPPPLASTCTVSSSTSYQNPTPSGKYMHQSHLTHHIKIPPPLASTCTVSSSTSYQNPTPSGKYMHSLILHIISKSHPLWQVHAQSHLTHHIKIPHPLASTCTVSSYTSYQNPTPSGKYMHSLILHIISKSHPLWQVHAQSHLTHHIKIPPPLASTCTVSSYTSYQNPTPSGNYMHSLIFHVISKSHPLWQVHAHSHLTHHIKIPPPLVSTCTVSSYTSSQNPTPSGKYMHSLIFHVISKSHPLWQVHAPVSSYTSYQNPTPSGKYMHSLIFHVISKSHPLWQVHAQSHLTHHIKIPPPLASTCTVSSYTSYQNPTPSGKYMHSLIFHVISKSHPLWQVHAQSHLTHHIKIPPPLASTCTVSSYTSYQNPTPSGKYMHSLILHIISKSHPLWQLHAQSHLTRHIKIPPSLASTCTFSSYTSYQNPTPSGKYMHSLILHIISKSHPSGKYMHSLIFHVISKSHPLWQVHAQSHLTHHIKIPPPLASTCTVSSYTSYQNPTPSGKYMHQSHLPRHLKIPPPLASTCTVSSSTSYQNPTPSGKYMHSLIFHVISKSHPLWQVHAQSHLTHHIKIPPPLASTCTVSSYTSYQNPTPSGKYMHSLIFHVISKSHPLWQVHAQSHLTHHIKIPPPLASTCTVSSYTSYQNPTPSGKYMHNLIFHVISKSHPLWQVHAQSHLPRHIRIPTPSGKYMHSLILHIISKSHPLWQVHAQSHLTHHIKIPPPLASTCTVSSSTSYQNPTPSGKYMHSLIFHIISKSHPLWQVHAQSHLTHHIKIPPPLASTCTVSSYTSYQNPPLWQVWRICSKTLWKPHVKADDMRPHREKGSCSNPPIRWSTRPSGCMNYYICFWNHSWRSIVCGSWFTKHSWRSIVCGSWFTKHSWRSIVYGSWFTIHSLRAMVYESWPSWFTNHGLRAMVYESWFTIHSLWAMVYEPWFTIHSLRAMVYRSRSQPINRYQ